MLSAVLASYYHRKVMLLLMRLMRRKRHVRYKRLRLVFIDSR